CRPPRRGRRSALRALLPASARSTPPDGAAAPIGVFDSGVGGLSVLREIRQLLPSEDLIYVADSAHCPYGAKSPDAIRERAGAITALLRGLGVKAIVVACNTATAAAIDHLRRQFQDLP